MRTATTIFASLAALAIGAFPQAAAAEHVAPEQRLATLLAAHEVRAGPGPRDRSIESVNAARPITGERTVLPVLGRAIDSGGRAWLRVRLPGRVLGASSPPPTGWITASGTQIGTTAWHVVVDLRARRLLAYRGGRLERSYPAIVGKPSTPTPTGEYFVEETVRLPSTAPGAPFALATSARSNVFQEFEGGPGQVAIHGIENLGGRLGTAESHGCVRLTTAAIAWLAARVTPGVPVTIR
jgi:lipoprotein-anchoring transpeptidase ErfK/SrfK